MRLTALWVLLMSGGLAYAAVEPLLNLDLELSRTGSADPSERWAACAGLALWGDPLRDGCYLPAVRAAEAALVELDQRRGHPAVTIDEAAPRLWQRALSGYAAEVDAALNAFPSDDPQVRAIRCWCRRDWRLLDGITPLTPMARLALNRALLTSLYLPRYAKEQTADASFPELVVAARFGLFKNPVARQQLIFSAVQGVAALVADPQCPAACHAALQAKISIQPEFVVQLDAALAVLTASQHPIESDRLSLAQRAQVVRWRLRLALMLAWSPAVNAVPLDDPARLLPQTLAKQWPDDMWTGSEKPLVKDRIGWSRRLSAEAAAGAPPAILRAGITALAPARGRAGDDALADQAALEVLESWRAAHPQDVVGLFGIAAALESVEQSQRVRERERLALVDPWAAAHVGYDRPLWELRPVADFSRLTVRATWRDQTIDVDAGSGPWPQLGLSEAFGIIWSGTVRITKPGVYRFATASDDGSLLTLNGELLVDNGGTHGTETASAAVRLNAGLHPLEVRFWDVQWGATCRLLWQPPGASALQIIPVSALQTTDGTSGLLAQGGSLPVGALTNGQAALAPPWKPLAERAPWSMQPLVMGRYSLGLLSPEERTAEMLKLLREQVRRDPASSAVQQLTQIDDPTVTPAACDELESAAIAAGSLQADMLLERQMWRAFNRGDQAQVVALASRISVRDNSADIGATLMLERLQLWREAAARHATRRALFDPPRADLDRARCLLQATPSAEERALALSLVDKLPDSELQQHGRIVLLARQLTRTGAVDQALRCRVFAERGNQGADATLQRCIAEMQVGALDTAIPLLATALSDQAFAALPNDERLRVWLLATLAARWRGVTPPLPMVQAVLQQQPQSSPSSAEVSALLGIQCVSNQPVKIDNKTDSESSPQDPWLAAVAAAACLDGKSAQRFAEAGSASSTPSTAAACQAMFRWLGNNPDAQVLALRLRPLAPEPGPSWNRTH